MSWETQVRAIRRARTDWAVALAVFLMAALGVVGAWGRPLWTKCGSQIHAGCDPGSYNCCSWTGFPCAAGGQSKSKEGIIYTYNLCQSSDDPNDVCNQQEVVCQQDRYYYYSGCYQWCNNYTRYVLGCYSGAQPG